MIGFLEDKISSGFLIFNKYNRPSRKTFYITVENKEGEKLGDIHWERGWRKYVFAPIKETIYDSGCLKTIFEYIDKLMLEREK